MKFYVACSLTESRDREVVEAVIRYLESQGHQVLDEHVAHEDSLARFQENTGHDFEGKSEEYIAQIVRDVDLKWVGEADAFIGLFLSLSEGAAIEFERRRYLLELQHYRAIPQCIRSALFLCIFLKERKRSRILHGISQSERNYITQEYLDNKDQVLSVVQKHVPPRSYS